MSLAGTSALTEFWAKCKAWFGRSLGASTTATTVSVQLKNNAGDDLGNAATIPAATTTAAGAMTADDKTKLNGIASGATANIGTITGVTADSPITGGGSSGSVSVGHATQGPSSTADTSKGDTSNQTPAFGGTFKVPSATVNKYGHTTALADHTVKIPDTVFGGASSSAAGSKGLVPAPAKGDQAKFLQANGSWGTPVGTTYSDFTGATISAAGDRGLVPAPPKLEGAPRVLDSDGGWSELDGLIYEAVGETNGFVVVDDSASQVVSVMTGSLMTDAQVTKLSGIAAGAEVNQNAFSTVKVGTTDLVADTKSDTLTITAGSNVTLTPNASGDSFTIAATDTKALSSMTGTLGLNHGGTGATTADAARTNLNVYSKSEVDALMTSATVFQDTVSSNDTISGSNYKKGWYWVVATAGTYVGQSCEAGDMIFAIKDKGTSYSANDFSVVQNNIVEMTVAEVDAICV